MRPPWANGGTVLVYYDGTDTSPADLPFVRFSEQEIEEHDAAELASRYRQRREVVNVGR